MDGTILTNNMRNNQQVDINFRALGGCRGSILNGIPTGNYTCRINTQEEVLSPASKETSKELLQNLIDISNIKNIKNLEKL